MVVAHTTPVGTPKASSTRWLRCVRCMTPHVEHDGKVSPGDRPLSTPKGVHGLELKAWEEVRDCLSVGAFTASVMLCRKILFHVAVADGLPAKDNRNRAPNFAQVVAHLESSGLVTLKMVPWVNRIKNVGNEASHEINPIDRDKALDVARFTEQLLRLAYEMDHIMSASLGEVEQDEQPDPAAPSVNGH